MTWHYLIKQKIYIAGIYLGIDLKITLVHFTVGHISTTYNGNTNKQIENNLQMYKQ